MKRGFFAIQIISLSFCSLLCFASPEDVLKDPSRLTAPRALMYKLACLKDVAPVEAALEEEITTLTSVPITLENDETYVRLNDRLEEIAQERGVSWPKIPQTPFEAEAFRAKVLERLPHGTQKYAIDGSSAVPLLYEDPSNPATAFAVMRARPIEVKIYEMAQALGLDIIVPTIRLKSDSPRTAAVFQRPLDWSLIPHLPMRHLLFVDLFAEPKGSFTLLRLKAVERDNKAVFEKYRPYFLGNISKENIDQIWLYWALFRPYDALARNIMITVSPAGKFEFKCIDLEGMGGQSFLIQVLTPAIGIEEVTHPFCPATLDLLERWKDMDLKMFDIEPEFSRVLRGPYLRTAFEVLRDQGSSWATQTTLSGFMRQLPTVPDLLEREELELSCCFTSDEEEETRNKLRRMISEGKTDTQEYYKEVVYHTKSMTQEYLRYSLYVYGQLRLDDTKWSYEGQERTDFNQLITPRALLAPREGNYVTLKGLMLYTLGLGSLKLEDGEESVAYSFFEREVMRG